MVVRYADGRVLKGYADFDPEQVMTPKEARRTDRFAQLAIDAAHQAAAEADLPNGVDPRRIGVIVGTGVGGLTTLQAECTTWLKEGDRAVSPLFVPMMMPNAAAGQIAMRLGLHGPGFSIASACSTGAGTSRATSRSRPRRPPSCSTASRRPVTSPGRRTRPTAGR